MRRLILRAEPALLLAAQENLGSLLSRRQLFTYSNHLCLGQVIWVWWKGEPCCLYTSFWIKGWAASQLVELDFVLQCDSRRQDSGWSERAQGTDVLPGGLSPACPS